MRVLACSAALIGVICAHFTVAVAQEATAAGSLGVGMFGDDPTTTVDVGLDVAGDRYAFGIGARLRYLAGDGVRSEDWDELSEVARLVRYFTMSHGETVRTAVAVGELAGASLGHGTIVNRYVSGLDVDHGHLGAQLGGAWRRIAVEALIDDLIRPRIVAARGSFDLGTAGLRAGISAVADLSAPSMDGSTVVPLVGIDLEARGSSDDELFDGVVYTDVVAAVRTGAGLHLGASGSVALGDTDTRLGARAEARLATAGYVPSWIGPLYERVRGERLDHARMASGGAGGLGELSLAIDGVGEATVSYASRPSMPRLATARLSVPHNQWLQTALWAATEVGGAEPARGLAFEARARLPEAMFIALEGARLYRTESGLYRSLWIATASVGAVVGE